MNKIQIYRRIVQEYTGLEVKGKTLPYTSVNGNMFSFFSNDEQLNLRLPDHNREDFITEFKSSLSVQHGVTMKEYVVVPDSFFKDENLLGHYFRLSYEYTLTLKPKASKKKAE